MTSGSHHRTHCDGCGRRVWIMSFSDQFWAYRRFSAAGGFLPSFSVQLAAILTLHFAAVVVMALTEVAVVPKLLFLLSWGLLNFFWMMVSRRPGVSAALSLMMVVVLVLMSRLKHEILLITVNFLDVMIIDTDTISFLLGLYPNLQRNLVIVGGLALPLMVWFWRTDPYRIRVRIAAAGAGSCLAGVTALCFVNPIHNYEAFFGDSYVSKFVRSGVGAVSEFTTHGLLDSDPVANGALGPAATRGCHPPGRRPH